MTKRKHRSKGEWRHLIEQQARSGLNGVAFCEQQGLSRKTFYRHRKTLDGKAADSVAGQFIKVDSGDIQTTPLQPGAVLHYRDSRLQLPIGSDPVWVAELMKALS